MEEEIPAAAPGREGGVIPLSDLWRMALCIEVALRLTGDWFNYCCRYPWRSVSVDIEGGVIPPSAPEGMPIGITEPYNTWVEVPLGSFNHWRLPSSMEAEIAAAAPGREVSANIEGVLMSLVERSYPVIQRFVRFTDAFRTPFEVVKSTFNRATDFTGDVLHNFYEALGTSIWDDNRHLKKSAWVALGLNFAGLMTLMSTNPRADTAKRLLKLLSFFLMSSLLGSMIILWLLSLDRPRNCLLKICCMFTWATVMASAVCAVIIVHNDN